MRVRELSQHFAAGAFVLAIFVWKKHGHMPGCMRPLWKALACVVVEDVVKCLSMLFGMFFLTQKLDELLNPAHTVSEVCCDHKRRHDFREDPTCRTDLS